MAANTKTTPGRRVLVVRINSHQDALSAVQNMPGIVARFREKGYDGIKFEIAKEVQKIVMAKIAGVFRVRSFLSYIEVAQGDELYVLPAFKPAPKPGENSRTVKGEVTLPTEELEPVPE